MKNNEFQLSGHVSYSIKTKYQWLTEPGACKTCLSMHGKIYDKNEVPKKPHPNCRCHVEDISVIDPEISAQYEYKEEIELLKLNAEKLLGDIRSSKNNLKSTRSYKLSLETQNEKTLLLQEADYTESQINDFIRNLNSKVVIYNINYIKEKHQEISNLRQAVISLNRRIEDLIVKIKKETVDALVTDGEKLAPDAAALWKLSATKFEDGLDYIKQNGYLVSQVSSLKNSKLEKKVTEKLHSQRLNTNSKGIVFHSNSSLAKSLTGSNIFKDFVKKIAVDLSLNDRVPDTSLNFGFYNSLPNNSLAIHRCDIVNIYLDNKNAIHAKVIDTVDYNSDEWWVAYPHAVQEHGLLENYYVIVEIEYPYEKWKEYLD